MKKWKKLAAAAVIGTAALAALSLGGCAKKEQGTIKIASKPMTCLLYTSPSPRD